jgi:hypothetical protein
MGMKQIFGGKALGVENDEVPTKKSFSLDRQMFKKKMELGKLKVKDNAKAKEMFGMGGDIKSMFSIEKKTKVTKPSFNMPSLSKSNFNFSSLSMGKKQTVSKPSFNFNSQKVARPSFNMPNLSTANAKINNMLSLDNKARKTNNAIMKDVFGFKQQPSVMPKLMSDSFGRNKAVLSISKEVRESAIKHNIPVVTGTIKEVPDRPKKQQRKQQTSTEYVNPQHSESFSTEIPEVNSQSYTVNEEQPKKGVWNKTKTWATEQGREFWKQRQYDSDIKGTKKQAIAGLYRDIASGKLDAQKLKEARTSVKQLDPYATKTDAFLGAISQLKGDKAEKYVRRKVWNEREGRYDWVIEGRELTPKSREQQFGFARRNVEDEAYRMASMLGGTGNRPSSYVQGLMQPMGSQMGYGSFGGFEQSMMYRPATTQVPLMNIGTRPFDEKVGLLGIGKGLEPDLTTLKQLPPEQPQVSAPSLQQMPLQTPQVSEQVYPQPQVSTPSYPQPRTREKVEGVVVGERNVWSPLSKRVVSYTRKSYSKRRA